MALFSSKSWDQWIEEYSQAHVHPVNKRCHTIGIPLIVISLVILPLVIINLSLWRLFVILFVTGWVFQFIGHYFEKKPPEFFRDWRFLFVGLRWWTRKTFGKNRQNRIELNEKQS